MCIQSLHGRPPNGYVYKLCKWNTRCCRACRMSVHCARCAFCMIRIRAGNFSPSPLVPREARVIFQPVPRSFGIKFILLFFLHNSAFGVTAATRHTTCLTRNRRLRDRVLCHKLYVNNERWKACELCLQFQQRKQRQHQMHGKYKMSNEKKTFGNYQKKLYLSVSAATWNAEKLREQRHFRWKTKLARHSDRLKCCKCRLEHFGWGWFQWWHEGNHRWSEGGIPNARLLHRTPDDFRPHRIWCSYSKLKHVAVNGVIWL